MVFAPGTTVDLGPLGMARIVRLLGQGGQGYVYEVSRSGGVSLALKWYKPQCASPEQLREIQSLVDFGSPHSRFLWPLSVARITDEPGFGYVMALRKEDYLELNYLLAGVDHNGAMIDVSFNAALAICRHLSMSFRRLHARGLCYRDISFGNVLFEPNSGDVLICDNDNVGIDNGSGRVLGTPFFMAPEVVSDTTFRTLPNTETDRHSLAVLLFYVLFMGHPLEGRRTEHGLRDQGWLLRHFGKDALFCLHPDDESNRPADIVVKYWQIYPAFLRDLFVHAFVHALHVPDDRVTEGQWIKAIDRLRDGMTTCRRCHQTQFWDPAEPDRRCGQCGESLRPALVLSVGRRAVAVNPLAQLRSDHLTSGSDDDAVVGRVHVHPQDADRLGLRNVTNEVWKAVTTDGREFRVAPHQVIDLTPAVVLHIQSTPVTVTVP